jgi:hypothetical protein
LWQLAPVVAASAGEGDHGDSPLGLELLIMTGYDRISLMTGWWFNNLEKYESQWEGLFHIYILWNIKHV